MAASHPKLDELIAVLAQLRAPGGCAWDADQTHESLVRYLVEETYELIDAIETGDRDAMLEELGDVLYQVVFHADLAAHTPGEDFTIEDVAAHMTAKMVGRHPHVFGDAAAREAMNIQSADDVVAVWDELKAHDKPDRSSVLDGIPQGMPALALADKLAGRAEKVGVAIAVPDAVAASATEAELGAQLLGIASTARAAGLDPERALRTALRGLQEEIRAAEAAASPVE
ncbi:XTP/dITP diphosphohydrolase [Cryobacterium mesophilum]|uniref:MazG family protein n=1 Tax=Terrimesophilobacter mesophilus TaxID=433647 RepID=A0A4R8VE53_9MICO|nr:MazG family protein [Terrimesophilobacter mesophilus]MBB5633750.1 XTP/dITP diphosphohydrolase [Terrimesophilobacter mesophilus]TFB80432.1 MazG family protein [Terrimesophilobacter mesophilus]